MARSILLALGLLLAACGAMEPSDGKGKAASDSGANGAAPTQPTPSPGSSPAQAPGAAPGQAPSPAPGQAPAPGQSPVPADEPPPCRAPDGTVTEPRSVDDVVALINALPKPVTLACYLQALKRPLYVQASSSTESVQPAVDAKSPRLFIFAGSLVTAVAVDGEGSALLELSVLVGTDTSVKAELELPVNADLTVGAAFAHVLRKDGKSGTRCGGCHFGEGKASVAFQADAYVSRAFRPRDRSLVSLESVAAEASACTSSTPRCRVLKAVFGHGEVKPQAFPAGVPTMF